MQVKTEKCFNGHNIYFRLTMPDGRREHIERDYWDRTTGKMARDLIENLYHVKRNSIRFI